MIVSFKAILCLRKVETWIYAAHVAVSAETASDVIEKSMRSSSGWTDIYCDSLISVVLDV
jgi:hypothetical protein